MVTVTRLLHSPVKGLALVEREALELGPEGAPFDRRFFVVNAAGELAGSWSHGRLCLTEAEYDGTTLTMRFPDGTVVSAPDPGLGEPVELIWDSDEPARPSQCCRLLIQTKACPVLAWTRLTGRAPERRRPMRNPPRGSNRERRFRFPV